jgi:hypothetical protein
LQAWQYFRLPAFWPAYLLAFRAADQPSGLLAWWPSGFFSPAGLLASWTASFQLPGLPDC